MLAGCERAKFAVDEGNDLAREIVRVIADRGGVHVLVAAERREAVRKHDDRRPHLLLAHEERAGGAFGALEGHGVSRSGKFARLWHVRGPGVRGRESLLTKPSGK